MAEETDVARRIAQLEAELGKAKAEKHPDHANCVTPCDSIRIQSENHSAYLLMTERAEKAEASSSRLLRECEGLREALKLAKSWIGTQRPHTPNANQGTNALAAVAVLFKIDAALSRQEPAPKPEAECDICGDAHNCGRPGCKPAAAMEPCGEHCQDAPSGSGGPCGKPHLPAPQSQPEAATKPKCDECFDGGFTPETDMSAMRPCPKCQPSPSAPDGKELSVKLEAALEWAESPHNPNYHIDGSDHGRTLAAEVRRLHKMNQEKGEIK